MLYLLISLTVVLYLLAIEYKLSPFFTVYTIHSKGSLSLSLFIFKLWPIDKLLLVKLFNFLIDSTDVLNLLAIPYKVSPDTIFM